jgi:hypothetical protein
MGARTPSFPNLREDYAHLSEQNIKTIEKIMTEDAVEA